MQLIYALLGAIVVCHGHESKATVFTRHWIARNANGFNLAILRKHVLNASLIDVPSNTQNKEASSTRIAGFNWSVIATLWSVVVTILWEVVKV